MTRGLLTNATAFAVAFFSPFLFASNLIYSYLLPSFARADMKQAKTMSTTIAASFYRPPRKRDHNPWRPVSLAPDVLDPDAFIDTIAPPWRPIHSPRNRAWPTWPGTAVSTHDPVENDILHPPRPIDYEKSIVK